MTIDDEEILKSKHKIDEAMKKLDDEVLECTGEISYDDYTKLVLDATVEFIKSL